MRALYGCTAHHWRYVYNGLESLGFTPDLLRPYELGAVAATVLSQPVVPTRVRSIAGRRAGKPDSPGRGLGPGEFILPAFVHTGRPIRPEVRRVALDLQARRLARQAHRTPGLSFIQFTDGLGHRLNRARLSDDALIVCERRNLHHAAFTMDLEPILDLPYTPLQADPVEHFLDREYGLADRILVYSEYAAQTFVNRGIPRERLIVSPLPAPAAAHQRSPIPPSGSFLFVGRCEAVKGIDLAVAATRLAGTHLTVAGPATEPVQRWLANFGHVDYVGVADRRSLDRLMAEATALIMPSFESYGLVLLEAAAAGLPVLASTTAGAAEYLGLSGLGLLVESRDPAAWAAAVSELAAANPSWREHVINVQDAALESLDETSCSRHYMDALTSSLPALGRRDRGSEQ